MSIAMAGRSMLVGLAALVINAGCSRLPEESLSPAEMAQFQRENEERCIRFYDELWNSYHSSYLGRLEGCHLAKHADFSFDYGACLTRVGEKFRTDAATIKKLSEYCIIKIK